MLRSIKEITGYTLAALDGKIGRCKDFLFDDQHWTIRYMVADTARWLPGRKVLIPPSTLNEPAWASKALPVRLTQKQIENAPDLDEHAPVSRQYEERFYAYYGWPYYWASAYAGDGGVYPPPLATTEAPETKDVDNPHLRSVDEVTGYHIKARDGEVGHVEDFIIDDTTWIIRYMVIDTRNWLPGRKVLVAPTWINRLAWAENKVYVDLTGESIENSPEFNPQEPVNRRYEERLYNYYGEPIYWG